MNALKRWLASLGRPAVWAHRGASAHAPENSLAALRLASELGADGVEFDVQALVGGELVVFHDSTWARCTGRTGVVTDSSLAFSQALSLDRIASEKGFPHRGECVPRLAEWLSAVPPQLFINLEVKSDVLAETVHARACVSALEAHGLHERAIVSSFHPAALWHAAGASPNASRGVLIEDSPSWKALLSLGLLSRAVAVHPQHTLITELRVRWWHRLGLMVAAWTVDEEGDARRCLDAGVDVLISNRPDRIVKVAERYSRVPTAPVAYRASSA